MDEFALVGSATEDYAAACKVGYTLKINGSSSVCFKTHISEKNCYKQRNSKTCFACDSGFVIKNNVCEQHVLNLERIRNWAYRARKLEQLNPDKRILTNTSSAKLMNVGVMLIGCLMSLYFTFGL